MNFPPKSAQFSPQKKEAGEILRWRSEELFKGNREVVIEHGQTQYRLLITKAGKLILTK
jgi:hemin uptake protein HemP